MKNPDFIFKLLVFIIIIKYLIDSILNFLNVLYFKKEIPAELQGIYTANEYQKSQQYQLANYKFGIFASTYSLVLTLLFFFLNGFAYVNEIALQITSNKVIASPLFFGIIFFASDILNLPFSYYSTFVIEEKFGFNKTTVKTFWLDKLKTWLFVCLIGGFLITVITWLYYKNPTNFWWYAWLTVVMFTLFFNKFYATLIVPLFNKQTPLQNGELKEEITYYAKKVGFSLKNIFVIDGSKRSTKANAYFSGFGKQKRITLYDTLIEDLSTKEIVAVLAHEVGHYKKKHIIYNLLISILSTGALFYILAILLKNKELYLALGVSEQYFHIGLIVFSILYSPISEINSFLSNFISRKFEYQADRFAKKTFSEKPLISALKKLSKNSLSNLTPHPFYVKMYYSHPTLLQRILALKK